MVSVHPARRRTSPRGVVPVGLGDGVGHCHDVVSHPGKCLFYFPFVSFRVRKLYSFSKRMVFLFGFSAEYASS